MIPPLAPPESQRADLRALVASMRRATGRRFWVAFTLLVLSNLTEGTSILLLLPILHIANQGAAQGYAVDLGGRTLAGLPLPDVTVGLSHLLIGLVCLVALQAVFNRAKAVYLSALLFDYVNEVRGGLFRAVAEARWDAVVRLRAADLEHALTGEVERSQAAAFQALSLMQVCVALAVMFLVSLLVSVPMTLFAFGFGALAFVALYPLRRLAARYGARVVGTVNRQYRIVSEFLAGLKTAKSMNLEPGYVAEFEASLRRMKSDATDYVGQSATGAAAFQLSAAIGAALFVWVALIVVDMPFVEMLVLLVVLLRVAPRFQGLQGQAQQLLLNLPSVRRVADMRALVDAEREPLPAASDLPRMQRGVRLVGVSYGYAGAVHAAVADLTLDIPAGQITALIGRSGSGKSTVADLVMGLIAPQAGRIELDGRPLAADELRAWRRQIGYVPQETFLLHDTIRANLSLAAPDADDALIWRALDQAQAGFVRGLPDGIATVVGDRGLRLSGGERQRIALARALLQRPALLILDEATSALDWEAQAAIARTIRALAGEIAVLTVAHRPSMVAFADRIHAIENGRVVESGTAAELGRDGKSHFARMMAHESTGALMPGSVR